jgi:Uma2 family endonuclease
MRPEATTVDQPARPYRIAERRRVGPRSAGILMTPEEYDALPPHRWAEGYRYELINGVLVVSPRPLSAERDPNEDLGHLLRTYQDTNPQGKALDKTLPEQIVPGTPQRRYCDRAIWAGLGRLPDEETDVPTIAVEFVSGGKTSWMRDYETKRDEYRTAGVREYWIIDRFRRTMTIHRFGAADPQPLVIAEDGTYQTELLPGFVLPLGRLLRTADSWKRPSRKKPRKRGGQ